MVETTRVSVIIPVWNLWDMTETCLRSLAQHSAGEHLEVVVVDNHSTDATATELEPLGKALFGELFAAVRMPENVGFAKGCNAGARVASGDLLFFLNNDTTLTPGWLPPLREAMADARVGAAGPLLLYPDGTVQHCGIYISPFNTVGHLYEHLPGTFAAARKNHPLQAITGAAIMLRKGEFADCGGFHEEYRNGFEDIDLCFALRARGLKLRVKRGDGSARPRPRKLSQQAGALRQGAGRNRTGVLVTSHSGDHEPEPQPFLFATRNGGTDLFTAVGWDDPHYGRSPQGWYTGFASELSRTNAGEGLARLIVHFCALAPTPDAPKQIKTGS